MSPSSRWSVGHIYTPHRPPLHPPLPPSRLFHLPPKAQSQVFHAFPSFILYFNMFLIEETALSVSGVALGLLCWLPMLADCKPCCFSHYGSRMHGRMDEWMDFFFFFWSFGTAPVRSFLPGLVAPGTKLIQSVSDKPLSERRAQTVPADIHRPSSCKRNTKS